MDWKKYLSELKNYIIFSFLIFSFSIFYGYFLAKNQPESARQIFSELKATYQPFLSLGSFEQFIFIIINNTFTLFLILALAVVFGIVPFLSLFSNGGILGILLYLSEVKFSLTTLFKGILPHGILEIPILILAGAMGLKIGRIAFQKVFKKEKRELKKEIILAFKFFIGYLFPLLILAGVIEVFITAKLLL